MEKHKIYCYDSWITNKVYESTKHIIFGINIADVHLVNVCGEVFVMKHQKGFGSGGYYGGADDPDPDADLSEHVKISLDEILPQQLLDWYLDRYIKIICGYFRRSGIVYLASDFGKLVMKYVFM